MNFDFVKQILEELSATIEESKCASGLKTIVKEKMDILTKGMDVLMRENETLKQDLCHLKIDNSNLIGLLSEKLQEPKPSPQPAEQVNHARYRLKVFPSDNSIKSSEATKQILRNTVNMKNENIGVLNVSSIERNGVMIVCRSEAEINKMVDSIKASNKGLIPKIQTRKNPVLTFVIYEEGFDWNQEEVLQDILIKNDLSDLGQKPKILHSAKTKNGYPLFIMETPPAVYKRLMIDNGGHVQVSYTRAKLREKDPVTQCRNCWRMGHIAKHCRFEVNGVKASRCCKCTKVGCEERTCSSPPKCSNCIEHNNVADKRGWEIFATDHFATSRDCQSYKICTKMARSLINYP